MRRIRRLGLATMLAVAATACLGAASVSAWNFESDKYPVEFEGKSIWNGSTVTPIWSFAGDGNQYQCDPGPLTGTIANAEKNHEMRPSMPDFDCWFGLDEQSHFEMNGCTFVFHPGEHFAEKEWKGTVDLGDAPNRFCNGIVLNGSKGHCKYSVAAVEGLSGVTFKNVSSKPETIELKMNSSFPLKKEAGGILCHSTGALNLLAAWEFKGYELSGGKRGPQLGFWLAGEEKKPPELTTKFEAEQYAATISGTQSASSPLALTIGERTYSCTSTTFSGTLSAASSALSMQPAYSGCTAAPGTLPAEINAMSCSYGLHVFTTDLTSPFGGSSDVSCSKEGDGLEVLLYANAEKQKKHEPLCVYKASPQSGLETTEFQDFGIGTSQGISAKWNIENMAVTKTLGGKVLCGEPSQTAKYTGEFTLQGTNKEKAPIAIRVHPSP